jgi:DNA-directed RNA polymerase subunit RPC12/RpoP
MTDIFDTTIACKKCGDEMEKILVNRQGFELRAVECPNCHDKIIHPADVNGYQHYNNIKDKTFHVKLRMVGNSHAISIPKEIIEFMQQQESIMDDMVKLCFEDMRKLRIEFGEEDDTK